MMKRKKLSPKPKVVSSPSPKHKQKQQQQPPSSSDKKPKPSRKPSVLVSRQFNIADALSGYHKQQAHHSSTTELIDKKYDRENQHQQKVLQQKPQKLMWKGRDGTPLPLIVPDRLGSSSISIGNTTTTTKKDHSLNVTNKDNEGDKEYGNKKDVSKQLNTFEDIFAHFEKYRFDHDSNELNDEILKVANDNISVPWITDLMKDLIVKSPSTFSNDDDQSFSLEQPYSEEDECQPRPDATGGSNQLETHQGIQEIILSQKESNNEGFDLPSSVISTDSQYFNDHVKSRNKEYEKACIRQRKEKSKLFTDRPAQTFHSYQVDGWSQTDLKFRNVAVGYDDEPKEENDSFYVNASKNFVEEVTSAAMMTDGCLFDLSDGYKPGHEKFCPMIVPKSASYSDIQKVKAKQKFAKSKLVCEKIALLERAIQQNNFSSQQVKYRGIVNVKELQKPPQDCAPEGKGKNSLELLFKLECEMTSGMKTNAISWNHGNEDIFAVGYGSNRFASHDQGFVILWSFRNPAYPEKIYNVTSPVTAIDFATQKPQMLAVGLMDGRILVYDTSSQDDPSVPLLESAYSPGRHISAVTELIWVTEGHQDLSEKLVSVSIDGRVLEWSLKKGLSSTLLMTLKRNDPKLCKGKLPNLALGLSMDFLKDGKTYITGTDDGSLYYCSRSYVGRPISVIRPHNAPLTALKYSHSSEDAFMTASSDSKVKIHLICKKEDSIHEVIEIHPSSLIGAVTDVTWSPTKSTLFVLLAEDERLEIWDVSSSVIDPIIFHKSETEESNPSDQQSNSKTVVQFSLSGDVIVVGDENGVVEIYRLHLKSCGEASPSLVDVLKSHLGKRAM